MNSVRSSTVDPTSALSTACRMSSSEIPCLRAPGKISTRQCYLSLQSAASTCDHAARCRHHRLVLSARVPYRRGAHSEGVLALAVGQHDPRRRGWRARANLDPCRRPDSQPTTTEAGPHLTLAHHDNRARGAEAAEHDQDRGDGVHHGTARNLRHPERHAPHDEQGTDTTEQREEPDHHECAPTGQRERRHESSGRRRAQRRSRSRVPEGVTVPRVRVRRRGVGRRGRGGCPSRVPAGGPPGGRACRGRRS